MIPFEKMVKLNDWLTGFLKICYLNLLWLISFVGGLGIFSAGPATYAMMSYYDHWLRLKEEPPVTRFFFAKMKENWKQTMLVGVCYVLAIVVTVVNIFYAPIWIVKMMNVVIFFIVLATIVYSFTLLSAIGYTRLWDLLAASFLLVFAFLPLTIGVWILIGVGYFVIGSWMPALLLIVGIGAVGFLFALVNCYVLRKILTTE